MVMDPRFSGYNVPINGLRFNTNVSASNSNLNNVFKLEEIESSIDLNNFMELPAIPPDRNQYNVNPSSSNFSLNSEEVSNPEDCDFSDIVLKYITQMLMEEDMEEKNCMYQESSAIQDAEKPFYEILGQKYPPSPDQHPLDHNGECSSSVEGNYSCSSSGSNSNNNQVDGNLMVDTGLAQLQGFLGDYGVQATPQSSFDSSNCVSYVSDGFIDTPQSVVNVHDLFGEHEPAWHFRKGMEEASKFLPNGTNLLIDLESHGMFPKVPKQESNGFVVKEEKKDEYSPNGSRGRKNLHREEIDLEEGRSSKHSAVFTEDTMRSDEFDKVLLCTQGKSHEEFVTALHETLKSESSKNGQSKVANGGKSRGKKQAGKKDVVDLRTLLIHCAQAVAADDRRSANELLKQIRQHSSPFGDGNQRLAHCFANGLEARLAGTGSQLYSALVTKRTTAADILKAYQLYLAACPFKKISNFFSNNTIYSLAESATRVHIVDFGISYGFQWPCLIQRLATRPGGPPKLRITGVDLPQPGFRPAERVEETGRRLLKYAEDFNVPFEYNAIAQKWETIQLEDLKIEPDELLIVNCLFRSKNLLDETVVLDSPRNAVLKLIKEMNPAVFIQGIVNGAYSAPFFITRFREALFHFSSLFDMLETNVPREHPERQLLERDIFGREALNVIACEGSERIERPETYKQWQVRNMRAGFQQLPLQSECMKKARDRVKTSYHKDFVIDQDSNWMLQGWKGRIIYGLSAWKPVQDS